MYEAVSWPKWMDIPCCTNCLPRISCFPAWLPAVYNKLTPSPAWSIPLAHWERLINGDKCVNGMINNICIIKRQQLNWAWLTEAAQMTHLECMAFTLVDLYKHIINRSGAVNEVIGTACLLNPLHKISAGRVIPIPVYIALYECLHALTLQWIMKRLRFSIYTCKTENFDLSLNSIWCWFY